MGRTGTDIERDCAAPTHQRNNIGVVVLEGWGTDLGKKRSNQTLDICVWKLLLYRWPLKGGVSEGGGWAEGKVEKGRDGS